MCYLLNLTFAFSVLDTNCLPFLLPSTFLRVVAARSALVKLFALANGKQRCVALPLGIVPQSPAMLP